MFVNIKMYARSSNLENGYTQRISPKRSFSIHRVTKETLVTNKTVEKVQQEVKLLNLFKVIEKCSKSFV